MGFEPGIAHPESLTNNKKRASSEARFCP